MFICNYYTNLIYMGLLKKIPRKKIKSINKIKGGATSMPKIPLKPIPLKRPDAIILTNGHVEMRPYDDDTDDISYVRQTIAFIRACDMCKDAATGGSIGNIVPIIFNAIGGDAFGLFHRIGQYYFPGYDAVPEKLISSVTIGKNIGGDLKDMLMNNNPKVKKAIGNAEIIDMLSNSVTNIHMYTLDANIVPSYYKCTAEYKKILEVDSDLSCNPLFDPKKITSNEYVITVATLLDPYKCTYGRILDDDVHIDDEFMKDSGFIAGDNSIDISGIVNPSKPTHKTDYTFNFNNFKVCGIDFKTKARTSSDLITFCSGASNTDNMTITETELLKAKLIAKECGDTLQAAFLNRMNNQLYEDNKLTLFTGDKGTFVSCMLYGVPSVFTHPNKRGNDICYYFNPTDNPTYDELLKEVDNKRSQVLELYNVPTSLLGGLIGDLSDNIGAGILLINTNYAPPVDSAFDSEFKPLSDDFFDNIFYEREVDTQFGITQKCTWKSKMYLIICKLKSTLETLNLLDADLLENADYNTLMKLSTTTTTIDGISNPAISDNETFTYWNTMNRFLDIFIKLKDIKLGLVATDHTVEETIKIFENKIKSSSSNNNDIDSLYQYIVSKLPLQYQKNVMYDAGKKRKRNETPQPQKEIDEEKERIAAHAKGIQFYNEYSHISDPPRPNPMYTRLTLIRFFNFNTTKEVLAKDKTQIIESIQNSNISFTVPIKQVLYYTTEFTQYKNDCNIVTKKRNLLNNVDYSHFFSETRYKTIIEKLTKSLITFKGGISNAKSEAEVSRRITNFRKNSLTKIKKEIIGNAVKFVNKIIETVNFMTPPDDSIRGGGPKRARSPSPAASTLAKKTKKDDEEEEEEEEDDEEDDEEDEGEVDKGQLFDNIRERYLLLKNMNKEYTKLDDILNQKKTPNKDDTIESLNGLIKSEPLHPLDEEFNAHVNEINTDISKLENNALFISLRLQYFADKINIPKLFKNPVLPPDIFEATKATKTKEVITRVQYQDISYFNTYATYDQFYDDLKKEFDNNLTTTTTNHPTINIFRTNLLQTMPDTLYDYMCENLIHLINTSIYPLFWCVETLESLKYDVSINHIGNITSIKSVIQNVIDVIKTNYPNYPNDNKPTDSQPARLKTKSKSAYDLYSEIVRLKYIDFNNLFKSKPTSETAPRATSRGAAHIYNSSTFRGGGGNLEPIVLKFARDLDVDISETIHDKIKIEPNHNYGQDKIVIRLDTIYGNMGQVLYEYLKEKKKKNKKIDIKITLLGLYVMVSMHDDEVLGGMPYYTNYSDKPIDPKKNTVDLLNTMKNLLEQHIEYHEDDCFELLTSTYHVLYEIFGEEIYNIMKHIFDVIYTKNKLMGYNVYRVLRCATFYHHSNGKPSIKQMHKMHGTVDDTDYTILTKEKNVTEEDTKKNEMKNFYIDKLNSFVYNNIFVCKKIMREIQTETFKLASKVKTSKVKSAPARVMSHSSQVIKHTAKTSGKKQTFKTRQKPSSWAKPFKTRQKPSKLRGFRHTFKLRRKPSSRAIINQ